jgi:hemerythrin-like metal-binding protein
MAIEWTPNLAVGYAPVDRQHQELFKRVDTLVNAMQSGQGKDAVDKTLAFLETYVVEHFSMEQNLMQANRYPQAAAHTAQHQAFLETFKNLKTAYQTDGISASLSIKLQQAVCGWLRDHIAKTDKALGAFLTANPAAKSAPPVPVGR